MSQHGCPERLSNRSKVFQEEGPSEPTMEVLVETLTGTAFEMTVSPSDTVFAIKSKIFRVEGIPIAQQHLLYNLKELEDSWSLVELRIGDGARLRLVLGMRGGPVSTRRLPPPAPALHFTTPAVDTLLDNRDEGEWSGGGGGSGCKVRVLVFRDGERVNMLSVKENTDGSYSPLEHAKYSASLAQLEPEAEPEPEPRAATLDNHLTMNKMADLRRKMESLSLHRHTNNRKGEKADIQKTRSEETLSVPSLLDEAAEPYKRYIEYNEDDSFAPLYDGNYTRYEYDCAFPERYALLPPIGRAAAPAPSAPASAEELARGAWRGARAQHSASASSLALRPAAPRARPEPLADGLFSSSTSELENIKRNSGRLLPALSRHRPVSQLHLSDAAAGEAGGEARRARCGVCRRRLGAATTHRCRCGAAYCAPHRYPEAHGCHHHVKRLPRI